MKSPFGFTLTEILMVLLLVSILSAVVIPQFVDFGDEAKKAVTNDRLLAFKLAIIGDSRIVSNGAYLQPGFEAQVGDLPNNLDELVTQGALPAYNPFTKRGWRGPYISNSDSSWNRDGWGNLLVYSKAGRTLTSCGPDGACGNADDLSMSF